MPADQIRDILTEPKVKTFETNRDRVVRGLQDIIDMIAKANEAGKGIEFLLKNSANYSQQKAEAEAATAQIKKLQEATKLLQMQVDLLTKAKVADQKVSQETMRTEREHIKLVKDKAREYERTRKAMEAEERQLRKSQSAYALLSAEYVKARDKARDMIVVYGEQDVMAKRAADAANRLNERLKAADSAVGVHSRNVGDYKNQLSGLSFSIQQMVREVPSVANNLAMLPLALSNQIGPLIDDVKRLIKANKILAAEGKATTSVFKTVAASIFSWQTLLMAGVALFVAYSSSAGEAAHKVGDFGDALKASTNSYAEARFELEAYKKAFEDTTTSMAEKEAMLEHYNRTWGDQAGHLKNVGQLEVFLQGKAQAFIDTLFLRAKATAALSAATELLTENMKDQANGGKDLVPWYAKASAFLANTSGSPAGGAASVYIQTASGADALTDANNKTSKSVEVLKKKYLEFSAKAANMAKANDFDLDGKKNKKDKKPPKETDLTNAVLDAEKELAAAIATIQSSTLEAEANRAKSAADNEKNALDQRLINYEQYFTRKQALVDLELAETLEKERLDHEKRLHVIEKANAPGKEKDEARKKEHDAYLKIIEASYAQHTQKLADLDTDYAEDQLKIAETSTKEQLRVVLQGAQDIENAVRGWENTRLLALNEQLEKKEISERKYHAERKRINAQADQQIFEGQQTYFKNYIDELERNGKLTKEIADKIRTELAKDKPGNFGGTGGKQGGMFFEFVKSIFGDLEDKDVDAIVSAYTKAFSDVYSAIRTVIANKYAAEIEGLESEMDAIKERYTAEADFINTLSITKEERERRLADLKARNTLKELDQQRRINDAKRRQARAEKTANIAETVGKTAIAVMNALSVKPWYLGAALAVAAGISGAAQIAAISSTPIPQYAKGRGYGKNEFALVNEQGAEAIVSKDGNVRVANEGKKGITFLAANEMVMTAEKTRRITDGAMLGKVSPKQQEAHVTDMLTAQVMDKVGNKIVKAVKDARSVQVVNIYDKGYYQRISDH